MPNWVANRVTIVGDNKDVTRVLDFVKSNESEFDFQNILPRPKELDITSGGDGESAMEYLIYKGKPFIPERAKISIENVNRMTEERREKALELGRKYLANIIRYGEKDWYDWNCRYWGTKWNSCDASVDGNVVSFDTAWNAPIPILAKLSELFGSVELHYMYADEDTGYNTGEGTFKGGELIWENNPEGGSEDAMLLYFETHEWARDEMHKDKQGRWVWNGSES